MGSQFWWSKLIPKVFIPFIAKYLQANQQKISSQVITLSDFVEKEKIQKIKLLKIDCEGEEINVLYGIQKNHWEKIESIVMEINDINHNLTYGIDYSTIFNSRPRKKTTTHQKSQR